MVLLAVATSAYTTKQKNVYRLTCKQQHPVLKSSLHKQGYMYCKLYVVIWTFYVQVLLEYDSGTRKRNVGTPIRRHIIKQVYRREYSSTLKNLQKVLPAEQICVTLAKTLLKEIEHMCHGDNCLLQNTEESFKSFCWDAVWNNLMSKAPTVLQFFTLLFPCAPKSLICFAISMVVRRRSPRMGLVQRVISTMMYGNGASKQVA